MKLLPTTIADVKHIQLDMHGDARGFFVERFHAEKMHALGIAETFVQDNHSRSAPNVLRGLHYQTNPAQGKLVGVTRGRIWDVAVDIRPESDTFGQWFGTELSDENAQLLWVPAGFAHGFCVLGDAPADVTYKCTAHYSADGDGGIRFDDPNIKVNWPIDTSSAIISERDATLQSFTEYRAAPPNWSDAT